MQNISLLNMLLFPLAKFYKIFYMLTHTLAFFFKSDTDDRLNGCWWFKEVISLACEYCLNLTGMMMSFSEQINWNNSQNSC